MQKMYCFKNAISFIKKGITSLSLLILLSVTVYSSPIDKNTDRKTGYNFFAEIPSFTSWPNSTREGSNSAGNCTYTLSANREVTPEAGNGTVTVTTGYACTWTVTKDVSWITFTTGLSGTGNGTVGYSYTANRTGGLRTGRITIGGQTYTVTQVPPPLSPDGYEPNNIVEQAYLFIPVFVRNASTFNISPANCYDIGDVDIYKINLEVGNSYRVRAILYDKFNPGGNNYHTLEAKISYSINRSTWNELYNRRLWGLTVQGGGDLYFKIQPLHQGEVGSYVVKIDINIAATPGCTFSLSNTSKQASLEAGSDQITVTTTSSCFWTAFTDYPWITLTSGQSGTGSGSVAYTYKANMATDSRAGTISIAGQTFMITQARRPLVADSYEPNNTVAEVAQASTFTPTFTENASTVSISSANCHNSSDIDIYKINLEDGYSYAISGALYNVYNQIDNSNYTLPGKVSYSTNGSTWIQWGHRQLSSIRMQRRTLYLKIEPSISNGIGTYAAKIDINRTADCNPVLSLVRSEVSSQAGNGQVTVMGIPLCRLLWTTTSGTNWITLTSGQSGTGNGSVAYSYTANTTWALRTGTITIAGQIYTVTQLPPPLTPDNYEGITGNNTSAQAYTFPQPVFNNENASSISISEANCHNVADVDIYKINLEAGYSYTISGALYDKYNQTAGSSYTLDVKISYSSNGSNWTDWGSSQMLNKTIQGGILYLIILPSQYGNVGTYAARIDIKKTATADCTYTFLPTREITPEAGNGQISVTTTGASCFRTATSNANWIILTSGQSATGSGSVAYTYKANMSTLQRSGTITIAGLTFTINQAGRPLVADSYEPNNTAAQSQAKSITPAFTGNASTVSISPATCHNSGDIDIYKINLEAGYSYTFSGELYHTDNNQINGSNYTLEVRGFYSSNGTNWVSWGGNQLSGKTVQGRTFYLKIEPYYQGRVGTYAAKIDLNRTVDCSPVLPLTSKEISSEAGNSQVTVTTGLSCTSPWTAAVTLGAYWITLTSGQSGTGSGSVAYTYQANMSTLQRSGTITIAENNVTPKQTFTINQAGRPLVADSYEPNNTVSEVAQAGTFTPTFIENTSTFSISPATCHNNTDIDIYKINLETGYSYTLSGTLFDRDNQAVGSSYTLDVRGFYSTNGDNWISWGDNQLPGKTVQAGTHYLKIEPFSQGNTGTYAAKIDINKTVDCSPVLSLASKEVSSEAGNDQVALTTSPSCTSLSPWTARVISGADWLTLTSGQSATVNGSLVYSYTANTAWASRVGTIIILGQTYRVTQLPPPITPDSYEGSTGNNTAAQAHTFPQPVLDNENASTISISEANCHNVDDVDIYKINLEAGYSYTISGALYDKYNQTAGSSYTLDVKISYSTNGSNWTDWGSSQMLNKTIQAGTHYLKIEPYSQGKVGTYAARIDIIKASTNGCTYTLLPTSREATPEADNGQIDVTITGLSCVRTATTNTNWITLTSGQSATGSGSVAYAYKANMETGPRTGTITIADKTFTINQAGRPLVADSFEPNNTVAEVAQASTFTPTFIENASTLSISPASCHDGDDVDIYKINLQNGYSYTISGAFYNAFKQIDNSNYSLRFAAIYYSTNGSSWAYLGSGQLPNKTVPGETLYLKIEPFFSMFSGTYAVKIDINRTVDCNPDLLLTSSEVSSEAGNGLVTMTANPLCTTPSPWTATVTSDTNWITLTSGQSGTGNGTVAYSYTANTAWSSRIGTITIANKTYTVTQLPPSLTPDGYEGSLGNNTAEQAHTFSQPIFNNESTLSISEANCHHVNDVDYYKINLEDGYIYKIRGTIYNQSNQTDGSNYTLDVRGFYSIDGTTWNEWRDIQWSNKTVQGGTLYLKIQPYSQGRVGTYAVEIDIKKTATVGCTYTLLPTSIGATAGEGNGQINVTTGPTCFRAVTSNTNWITLTSDQSGTGSGSVTYTYKANMATSQRSGTIFIAGQAFTITQAGRPLVADSFEPNNTVAEVAQAGTFTPTFTENRSTLSISPATCHNCTDIDIYKINLDAGYSYTLSGVLYDRNNNTANNNNYTLNAKSFYSIDGTTWNEWRDSQWSNQTVQGETLYLKIEPNSSWCTGTYAAKIDLNRTVDCSLLSHTSSEVSSEAGNDQVAVTTSPSCTSPSPWTATSGANWITLTSDLSGTGNGCVAYTYQANMATNSRTGTITIARHTFTITQAGRPLVADSFEPNNTIEEITQAGTFTPTFINIESRFSISPATCHNSTDIDIYKINLDAGYPYMLGVELYDTDNNLPNHTNYTLDVQISWSTDGTTWNAWGHRELMEQRVQGGTLYIKIIPYTRGNTGTYAAKIYLDRIVNCTPFLPLASSEVSPEAGIGQVTVRINLSCTYPPTWTATSDTNWITLTSGQSGTDSGSVAYSYQANMATNPRTGTITIDEQNFTITQAGRPLIADSFEPNNTVAEVAQASTFTPTFTENASTLSISPATCHNHTDIDIYKINLDAGYSYTLNGVLCDTDNNLPNHTNYTLDVQSSWSTDGTTWNEGGNIQLSDQTMQGTLYIKIIPQTGGNTGTYAAKIDLNRIAGCMPILPLASKEISSEAGNDQITVTTIQACTSPSPWTATSGTNWITLTSGQSGTGSGVVYTYRANMATDSRTGTISIAGQTFTITQAGRPLVADNYEPNNTVEESQAKAITPVFTENASTFSISPATYHNSTDIDIYKINLETGYSYTLSGTLYDMDNNQANHTNYTLDVKSSWSTDGTTWNEWGDIELSNPVVGGETLYIKIIPQTSGNTGTYAAKIDLTRSCSLPGLSPAGKVVKSETGNDLITVTTGASCTWEATAGADWITLTTGQRGTGNGTVGYSYSENTELSSRKGTITIAGQPFTITQEGHQFSSDSYEPNNTVSEVSQAATFIPSFTQKASGISIAPANCHHADDVDIYKINLETGYSYTVNGVLYNWSHQMNNSNYTLDARIAYSTDGDNWSEEDSQLLNLKVQGGTLYLKIAPFSNRNRTGTYAAKIDIVISDGCTYKLSPVSREATPAAGTDKTEVTAGSLCEWTATSNTDWITITSGQSGKGAGSIEYAYTENKTEASRTGTITVGGQTYTVNQSVITGIETIGNIKIFPNPAKDFVTIDFSGTNIKCASVKIANQLGQILYVQDSPDKTLQIPLKGFTGGVYFIFLQEEKKTWVQKLVIR